jgi:MFS family permease
MDRAWTPVRPRWLFLVVFIWLASHGRFLSLFFQKQGLTDTEIGILLAIDPLMSSFCAPLLGFISDRAESESWRMPWTTLKGHEVSLAVFIVISSAMFMLFGLDFHGFVSENCRFQFYSVVMAMFATTRFLSLMAQLLNHSKMDHPGLFSITD